MERLAEPSLQKSEAMRVRWLHEPRQSRRHIHYPDFPSAARGQELAPKVRVARVQQEYGLPFRSVRGKGLAPVPRDHSKNGIIHPRTFPSHQAHVREQSSFRLQLSNDCRWKHVLVTDDVLWQLRLDSGVLAEQCNQRQVAASFASRRTLRERTSFCCLGDGLAG